MNNKETYRLGDLLRDTGNVADRQLTNALREQQQTGESLGRILVRSGAIGKRDLYRTLAMQRCLRATSLTCALIAAPMAAVADDSAHLRFVDVSKAISMPSADREPVNDAEPFSVPIKALVERVAFGDRTPTSRRFSYDIDALQQGAAFRMKYKF